MLINVNRIWGRRKNMQRICWNEKNTNEALLHLQLQTIEEKQTLIDTLKKMRWWMIRHEAKYTV